jgi:nucleoside-diphosphate-sugar epimerase
VTGCAGFIGSHLTEALLEKGLEVIGIDCYREYYPREIKENNIASALKNRRFTFIERDIMDMKTFPEADYVFHLAAQAGVRASWGNSFEIYARDNVLATQRLLEFYKNIGIRKFVNSSSSSVYGDTELPMRETSLTRPVSPYGVTKLAAENLCYLYWKNYSLPVVSLRYFTVYGPRQRPDMAINKFVDAISNGQEVTIYGDGTQTRDFTYVEDVVNANILSAECTCVGETFNIGGGNRISVNDLIRKMESAIGKAAKVRYVHKQKGDADNTLADAGKAKNILHWASGIDISKGLVRYIDWYVNNAKKKIVA